MKKLFIILIALAVSGIVVGQSGRVRVGGYTKKDGTYVAPHYRTAPNKTQRDNYSSKGNYNPNTGKMGKKNAKK